MTKLLLAILLTIVPFVVEYSIDSTRTLMNKRNDKHFLTACIRFLFIWLAGVANPTTEYWWQGSLLAFSFHYLLYDGVFNVYVLDQRLDYLGNNPIDRIHFWIQSRIGYLGLVGFKLMILAVAITLYIRPCIYCDYTPF